MHAGRLPELHRELAKETLLTHIAAGALDLPKQGFGNREMLEESDNICKPLVKCQNIGICRFLIARVKSVEQRVRGLVRDDGVPGSAENRRTRQRDIVLLVHRG